MARRLGPNRRRERAIQQAMVDRATNRASDSIAKELRRAMRQIAKVAIDGKPTSEAMDEHRKRMESIFVNIWTDSANRFAARLEEMIGKAGKNAAREQRIREWIARHRGIQAAQVADSTVQKVMKLINSALSEGESVTRISNRLQSQFPSLAASRAVMIARTEVQSAAQAGQLESAKASGMAMLKEWVSSGDPRVRTYADGNFSHARADGEIVPVDEPFTRTGQRLDHPGDFAGAPGNIINCRCAAVYQIAE